MRENVTTEQLSQLLVDLNRSLLQYAIDVWPWSSGKSADDVRNTIIRVASHQRVSVARLAEYLDAQGVRIDLGVFPDEYTSLHFVSVTYLVNQMLENQRELVAECQELATVAGRELELAPLLSAIRDNEQRTLVELTTLQKSIPQSSVPATR